jgi:hypothetical protein
MKKSLYIKFYFVYFIFLLIYIQNNFSLYVTLNEFYILNNLFDTFCFQLFYKTSPQKSVNLFNK